MKHNCKSTFFQRKAKTLFGLSLMAVATMMALAGCEDEKGGNDNNDDNKSEFSGPGVKTLDACNVTETKALLCGLLSTPDQIALDFEFGFEISTESVFTEASTSRVKSKYYNENHKFSYQLENLTPDTTCYYRAYMINQMMLYQGEIKSFTTNDIKLDSGNIGELTCSRALITAKVSAEEEVSSYGIYYTTSGNPAHEGSFVMGSERDSAGFFFLCNSMKT